MVLPPPLIVKLAAKIISFLIPTKYFGRKISNLILFNIWQLDTGRWPALPKPLPWDYPHYPNLLTRARPWHLWDRSRRPILSTLFKTKIYFFLSRARARMRNNFFFFFFFIFFFFIRGCRGKPFFFLAFFFFFFFYAFALTLLKRASYIRHAIAMHLH